MHVFKHSTTIILILLTLGVTAQWKSTILVQKPFKKVRFAEDADGFIWLATDQGLYKYDGYDLKAWKNDPSDSTTISEDRLSYITRLSDGTMWCGYEGGGLSWFSPKEMVFHHIHLPASAGMGVEPSVRCIEEGRDGRIWAGLIGQGFVGISRQTGEVEHHGPLPEIDVNASDRSRIIYNSVYGIYDRGDYVWLATHNGFYGYNRNTKEYRRMIAPVLEHTAWRDDCYNHMLVIGDSLACLNSWMSGIQVYDFSGRLRGSYPYRIDNAPELLNGYPEQDDGLFEVRDMKKDRDGNIWLTTVGDGVLKFSMHQNTFAKYPSLLRTELFRDGCFVDSNGNLWVSCSGGIELYLSGQEGSSLTGRIRFTSLDVNQTGDVDVSYLALSYGQTEDIVYSYRISGTDEGWKEYGKERRLILKSLGKGNYTLEIRARKGELDWSEPASMSFSVHIPFTETLLFKGLLVALLSLIVYLLYQYRVGVIRKQESIKTEFNKKLLEEQMKALRAQMNPHFIFNSLNSINRQIIQSDPQSASHYLTKFAKLMRMVLDNSNQKIVELSKELEALKIYLELEQVRFESRFTFRIEVADNIQPENTFVPPLIIQPFVENAIWHGLMNKESDDGRIDVHVRREDDATVIVVEDNGVGRAMAESLRSRHKTATRSQGSRITEERLRMISALAEVETQDLFHANGEAAGTRVVIRIPN